MPELTGEQLTQKLLETRPDIPVVLCTGYSSRIDTEKAASIGIRAFIMKPLNNSQLAITIRQVLDNKN